MSPYHPGWRCCLNPMPIEWACSEELAHCVVGQNRERARVWQARQSGDFMPARVTQESEA
jgi:hypothetical protein